MKKLKIELSKYPEKDKEYILFLYSETKRGFSVRRIFKGTKEECKRFKNECVFN